MGPLYCWYLLCQRLEDIIWHSKDTSFIQIPLFMEINSLPLLLFCTKCDKPLQGVHEYITIEYRSSVSNYVLLAPFKLKRLVYYIVYFIVDVLLIFIATWTIVNWVNYDNYFFFISLFQKKAVLVSCFFSYNDQFIWDVTEFSDTFLIFWWK